MSAACLSEQTHMLECPDAPPPHPAGLAAATRHSASRQVGRTFKQDADELPFIWRQ